MINVTLIQDGSVKPKRMVVGSKEDQNATFVSSGHTDNKSSKNYEQLCDPGQAFTGISVLVDEGGGIKEWSWMCDNVLDPTEMCEPQESLGLVLQCDNSESGNELECSYSKTIGVGVSTTITETERQEMTFSAEFGYSIENGIPGLSASMSASLGFSELVGYEWSRSDTTTWTEETTVQATMKVRPYAHSKLEQLVGKCSFYGTSVNFFKQTDINVTSGEETISYFSM
ncbi:hypothetical protein Ocin01_16631 [Orchesella cincta]|uniref:Uncharacterized protein n=1 Tax=Orchesella cincta TaxID=48709 RepID=A0A1D2MAU0_ORCCI|nr:hypothetical protein Ocin01_16631 [Orchesella cincta]